MPWVWPSKDKRQKKKKEKKLKAVFEFYVKIYVSPLICFTLFAIELAQTKTIYLTKWPVSVALMDFFSCFLFNCDTKS